MAETQNIEYKSVWRDEYLSRVFNRELNQKN